MSGGCLIVRWGDRTAWTTRLSSSRSSTHVTPYTCLHHLLTCTYHTAYLLTSYTRPHTSCSTPAHIIHTSHVIHTPAHSHTCSHHAAHSLLLFNRLSGAYSHVSRSVPTATRGQVQSAEHFQSSACVTFAKVPVSHASHRTILDLRGREPYFTY